MLPRTTNSKSQYIINILGTNFDISHGNGGSAFGVDNAVSDAEEYAIKPTVQNGIALILSLQQVCGNGTWNANTAADMLATYLFNNETDIAIKTRIARIMNNTNDQGKWKPVYDKLFYSNRNYPSLYPNVDSELRNLKVSTTIIIHENLNKKPNLKLGS